MIRVSILRNDTGNIIGFKCSGHSGYAESGHDIICSAVSVLVINTVNSIEAFTDDNIIVEQDESKGLIHCRFNSVPSNESILLLNSLELGLKGVEQDYGRKFIRIQNKEV